MYQLLIVDDQAILADDLSHMIPWSELGIETVHTAYSAFEALNIIRSHPVDIVVTDIRMPGMSGIELIEEIGKLNPRIKTILLSGYADFEYAKQAIRSRSLDYLLKPASDEELMDAVRKAIEALNAEWTELHSRQMLEQSLRENMPILKEHLLLDLLSGRRIPEDRLQQRIRMLGLPLATRGPCCLMLIRMEDHFERLDAESISLFEYAIMNIAQEIFGPDFHIISCRDSQDYLILLLSVKSGDDAGLAGGAAPAEAAGRLAASLQHGVKLYLKGTVSVLLSQWVNRLTDVAGLYGQALNTFRQRIGNERELLLYASETAETGKARSLVSLYEPPTLFHLLEAGQWDGARLKLVEIFQELGEAWHDSHEHILEAHFGIAGAFTYIIHKSNRWLSQVLQQDFDKLMLHQHFHTIQQLQDWSFRILDLFADYLRKEIKDTRSATVKQIHEYAAGSLGEASLQSIAAHVGLNPSYLSKIYKLETGEGISEYLYRLRMERGAYLLAHSQEKIYEIAQSLGYQKTSYFIKLFKEKYGVTPQEYKDRLLEGS